MACTFGRTAWVDRLRGWLGQPLKPEPMMGGLWQRPQLGGRESNALMEK